MKPSGLRAYGYARVRAWKSRLLTREAFAPLLTVTDTERIRRSIDPPPFEKLMHIYATLLRTNRAAAPLLRAMLRLHEIENVKLLWRAIVRHRHFDPKLAVPLGSLATIPERAHLASTLRELTDALAKTAYGPVAANVLRVHADDLQSAELAFDRWASRQLLDEAGKLPDDETIARQLIEDVVANRDNQIVQRGEKWYGLHGSWSTGFSRSPVPRLKPPLHLLCRRAMRGNPFSVAPAIALVILAEAEVRAVRALIERGGDAALDKPFADAIAGSQVA